MNRYYWCLLVRLEPAVHFTLALKGATAVIVCLQQIKVADLAKAVSANKTVVQVLDRKFLLLKKEFQSLRKIDHQLKKTVDKMNHDIKILKLIQGKCTPCKAIKHTDKYCDCTNLSPKKDCLEFHKAGFKVRLLLIKS